MGTLPWRPAHHNYPNGTHYEMYAVPVDAYSEIVTRISNTRFLILLARLGRSENDGPRRAV
jgi:hypothetical protein